MSILSVVFAKPDDYPVCARFDAHISPAEFARKAAETALFARIEVASGGLSIALNKFEI